MADKLGCFLVFLRWRCSFHRPLLFDFVRLQILEQSCHAYATLSLLHTAVGWLLFLLQRLFTLWPVEIFCISASISTWWFGCVGVVAISEYLLFSQNFVLGYVNLAEPICINVFALLVRYQKSPLLIVLFDQILHFEPDSCIQTFIMTQFHNIIQYFINKFKGQFFLQ